MDDLGTTSLSTADRSLAGFGLVVGVIPFFVHVSESSSVSVNGHVTASTFRDWVAIGCGGAALVVGAIAVALAVRNKAGGARIALAAAAVALGALQLVRGFGLLEPKADSTSSVSIDVSEPPALPPVDNSPGHCPVDTCNDRGIVLEKAKDFAGALKEFTHGCELGDAIGCSNAANYWSDGKGVTANKERAAKLFDRGCDGKFGDACLSLGLLLYRGDGVPKDLAKALVVFEKGCAAKNGNSCKNAGILYRDEATLADPVKAIDRLTTGCETLADAESCNELGLAYGNKHDDAKAFPLYQRACAGGSGIGCYNVGVNEENGRGTKKDVVAAREAYKKGCDGDFIDACGNLAVFLDNGIGGPKDRDGAIELFKKACDAKDSLACTNLAKAQKRQNKK